MKQKTIYAKNLLLAGSLVLILSTLAQAANGTWTTNASANWSASANWAGTTIANGAGFTANFTADINPARIVTLDSNRTIGNIVFTDSTTNSHNLTISGANILTLDAGPGNVPEINVTQSARILTIGSQLSGSQGFKATGPGIIVLNNASTGTTLSGDVTINAGITQLLEKGAAGTGDFLMKGGELHLVGTVDTNFGNNVIVSGNTSFASARAGANAVHSLGNLTINGSSLALTKFGATTTGTLSFTSTTLTVGAVSTFSPATATLFDIGAVTGNNTTGITKTGAGTLIFSANSPSYAGTTTISDGVLQVGNNGTTGDLGSGAVSIASGKTLAFARTNAATFNNAISGAGGIRVSGGTSTVITLTNASYTGSTLLQSGLLASNNSSTNVVLGQSGSQFNYGVLALNADFTGDLGTAAGNVSWAGNSASGGFAAMDAGTRIVNIGGSASTLTLGTGGFNNGTGTGGDSRIKFGDVAGTALGTVDFQNPIELGGGTRGARFVVDGAAQIAAKLSGAITGSGLASGTGDAVVKFGNGNLMLSGANTYTGRTVVGGQGAIVLGSAGAFSANTWMNLDGGANATLGGILGLGYADLNADLGTSGGKVNFNTSGGFAAFGANRSVTLNGGADLIWASTTGFLTANQNLILGQDKADATVTLTNGIDLNGAARTIHVNNGTSPIDAKISGDISGVGGSLIKGGAGTLILSGNNSYTGTTTVSAGTLLINGSLGNSSVTVASTATIGGSGTLAGALTVNGTLAPGNSIESIGTGNLAFGATATYAYELDTDSLNGDLTFSSGTLDIANGAILTLTETESGTLANGAKLTLISYDGLWNNGLFKYLGGTLADGDSFTLGSNDWRIDYDDNLGGENFTSDQVGASRFVTLTAIPEPSTAMLALSALSLSLVVRRRTR